MDKFAKEKTWPDANRVKFNNFMTNNHEFVSQLVVLIGGINAEDFKTLTEGISKKVAQKWHSTTPIVIKNEVLKRMEEYEYKCVNKEQEEFWQEVLLIVEVVRIAWREGLFDDLMSG